jgi:hypothetical protein
VKKNKIAPQRTRSSNEAALQSLAYFENDKKNGCFKMWEARHLSLHSPHIMDSLNEFDEFVPLKYERLRLEATSKLPDAAPVARVLTEAECANRIFEALDGGSGRRDGKLSYAEFAPMLTALNSGLSPEEFENCWNSIDLDRSGFLSKEEFSRFCSIPLLRDVVLEIERALTDESAEGILAVLTKLKRSLNSEDLNSYVQPFPTAMVTKAPKLISDRIGVVENVGIANDARDSETESESSFEDLAPPDTNGEFQPLKAHVSQEPALRSEPFTRSTAESSTPVGALEPNLCLDSVGLRTPLEHRPNTHPPNRFLSSSLRIPSDSIVHDESSAVAASFANVVADKPVPPARQSTRINASQAADLTIKEVKETLNALASLSPKVASLLPTLEVH